MTVLDGKGWYTKHSMQVLMIITRKTDLGVLLKYINSVDSSAFISVASVTGVYGKGFDMIKNGKKKKLIVKNSKMWPMQPSALPCRRLFILSLPKNLFSMKKLFGSYLFLDQDSVRTVHPAFSRRRTADLR